MWMVEARNYGQDPKTVTYGPMSETASRRMHSRLANTNKWAFVRSWDLEAERQQQLSNQRIAQWNKQDSVV